MKIAVGFFTSLVIFANVTFARDQIPDKHLIAQAPTRACNSIVAASASFATSKIRRATQYFIPMFSPDEGGTLRPEDSQACLKMEGSCIVGDYLYNAGVEKPYLLKDIIFKFGLGSGKGPYNRTGALDPCRTVAADPSVYPVGTALYIPALAGRICPQSLKPIDGCFIVGDVGSAIKGAGRFDIFTGECTKYDKLRSVCADKGNGTMAVRQGEPFVVVPPSNAKAKALRSEADAFIGGDWGR